MKTETYKNYTVSIDQDISPENPFEAWDCEPPLLAYYGGRHEDFKSYSGPESLADIVRMLPPECWERGERVKLICEYLDCSLKEFSEALAEYGSIQGAFIELLSEKHGSKPSDWRSAREWFDVAESLLNRAGIICHNAQSNGYSQGDSTLVLVIATPEWIGDVGIAPENVQSACESAFDLYSAWAWGDVYGITSITDPEGNELEEGSVWGFYGSDHEKSGLMDSARASIDYHIEETAKEYALLESALCSAE